jgi:hypothetical protein
MRWSCRRGCGAGGEKTYASAAEATKYATAFNAERAGFGERAPFIALLPLRMWKRLTRSR